MCAVVGAVVLAHVCLLQAHINAARSRVAAPRTALMRRLGPVVVLEVRIWAARVSSMWCNNVSLRALQNPVPDQEMSTKSNGHHCLQVARVCHQVRVFISMQQQCHHQRAAVQNACTTEYEHYEGHQACIWAAPLLSHTLLKLLFPHITSACLLKAPPYLTLCQHLSPPCPALCPQGLDSKYLPHSDPSDGINLTDPFEGVPPGK